jgi:ABC-type branched-subunit amino acid transport system ATPase component
MSQAAVEARGITKRFGGVVALADVSVGFPPNKVTGIVGPNGSGKSTLIDCLTGFQRPTAGRVLLSGRDVTRASRRTRALAGLRRTFQAVHVFPGLTVLDHLILAQQEGHRVTLLGEIARSPRHRRNQRCFAERAAETLALVELTAAASRPAAALSYGQQKLLGLACGLVSSPSVLCLDEPLAGVSPRLADSLCHVLTTLRARGQTLLIVEHNIEFVSAVSDLVVVLAEGSVIAQGEPSVLRTDENVFRTLTGAGGTR